MPKMIPPKKTGNAYLSKEINFLKCDSEPEKPAVLGPNEYLSDRICRQEQWMKSFIDRLKNIEIPDNTFTCAVINQDFSMDRLPSTLLDSIIKPAHGLMEIIDDHYIVIALWDKNIFNPVWDIIKGAVVGKAIFPFMDFSRTDTFYNAVKAVDHAAFLGPGTQISFNDVSLNISGDRLYQSGLMDEAAKEYKKGLAINKDNINLMNSLGVCYGINNDPEQAKRMFKLALEKNSEEVMVVYNMGLVCNILEQVQDALFYLQKASSLDNSIFEVELTTGNLLIKQGRFEKAIVHLSQAKNLNTKAAIPYRLLGEYFLDAKEIDRAIDEFKQAIKLNPMDAVSLSGLSHGFYLKEKNLKIAITLAKESIMINPCVPLFRSRLGKLYLQTGQKDLASIQFDMAKNKADASLEQEPLEEQDTLKKRSA